MAALCTKRTLNANIATAARFANCELACSKNAHLRRMSPLTGRTAASSSMDQGPQRAVRRPDGHRLEGREAEVRCACKSDLLGVVKLALSEPQPLRMGRASEAAQAVWRVGLPCATGLGCDAAHGNFETVEFGPVEHPDHFDWAVGFVADQPVHLDQGGARRNR